MSFNQTQVDALKAPLDRKHVRQREQAGRKLSYIEGWQAISEANRIFGFGEWSSETVEVRCVSEGPRKIGKAQRDGHSVSYIARVRVTVAAGDKVTIREGVGSGHGIDVDLGLAHESAIKESETDARKRALMTFGNPFGLALYDKDQANVADVPDEPEDTRTSSQRIADDIIAGLAERAGARVDRFLDHPEVKRDLSLLDGPDLDRVAAFAATRRAVKPDVRAA